MSIIPSSRFLRITALLAFAGLSPSVCSHAALLVYEGFTGYTAGQLGGQNPNANTVGLNQSVGYYDDGVSLTRTLNYTLQTTGLTMGSLATSGGALNFAAGTNVIGADLTTTHTGTLWSSYLVKLSIKGGAANDGAVIRIGDKPSDSGGGHFNSWADSRPTTASTTVSAGYGPATLSSTNGTASLTSGVTYIIINSFTRVGQSLSAGTPGVAKLWALTESQYTAFLMAGGTESILNSLTGSSVTATATNTLTSGTPMTFSSSDSISIVSVNGTGVFDELRFGSDLASVIPTAIPEPAATAMLIGLGCAAACGCRRPGPHRRTHA